MDSKKLIQFRNIVKSFDDGAIVLKGINLDIYENEFVTLLGPSGCGKTTTLRVIAGFIEPNDGHFYCDDQDYTKIPVHKRNFGLVFQSYALFPHLSVYDNVAFGLKLRKMDNQIIKEKVEEILESTDLLEYKDRFPKNLSGGQRQRVALARALVIQPSILLLDEPLSNLDAKLRLQMRVEIKRIQRKLGITTVFVTHDQEECFSISDKVAVMNNGVIEQYDTPEKIYARPKTEFVARFIGFENFIQLNKKENDYVAKDGSVFKVDIGCDKEECLGTIRPDDIQIVSSEYEGDNLIEGTVEVRTYLGKSYQYSIETALGQLIVNDSSSNLYNVKDKIKIQLPASKIVLV